LVAAFVITTGGVHTSILSPPGATQVVTEDALHTALDNDARNISITKSMALTGARAQGSTHFLLGAPGTHILLQGVCNEEGEPTVTIDAAGTSKRHFGLASGSSVTLKCLKLSNGVLASGDGGAVMGKDIKGLAIENSSFEGNAVSDSDKGGAVFVENTHDVGNVYIASSSFVQNQAGEGGGLYLNAYKDTLLSMDDVEFRENNATDGGGIYLRSAASQMKQVKCTSNTASKGGGGMYMINDGNTRADIVSSRFDGNVASEGGAIHMDASTSAHIYTTSYTSNSADSGGAMYISQGSTSTFTTSTFGHNEAQGDGGAIYFESSARSEKVSSSTLKFCSFNGNIINSTTGKGSDIFVGMDNHVENDGNSIPAHGSHQTAQGIFRDAAPAASLALSVLLTAAAVLGALR